MSEATTRARIVNVASETITGIRTFYPNIPRVLQDAELPGLVVFPGKATYDRTDEFGESMWFVRRNFVLALYLVKALYGTEGQGEINADPFFSSVPNAYNARPGLELPSEGANQTYSCFQSLLIGDGGLQVGPYPLAGQGSPDYVQIQWEFQVQELTQNIYQD